MDDAWDDALGVHDRLSSALDDQLCGIAYLDVAWDPFACVPDAGRTSSYQDVDVAWDHVLLLLPYGHSCELVSVVSRSPINFGFLLALIVCCPSSFLAPLLVVAAVALAY